jgi:hypothetical protein
MVLTLASVTIGAAQSAVVANSFTGLQGENRPRESLLLEANFNAGNGDGTTVDAYVQSSADGGATWFDIANFHFTTASAKKAFNLVAGTPVTSISTPTDGSLSANTAVDGLIGDALRVKWASTGTYTGSASLTVTAVPD